MEFPPDTEVSTEKVGGEIKISVGIRNTIPHPSFKYCTVGPMINASISVPDDGSPDAVMKAVTDLYHRLIPPYCWLLVQQIVLTKGMESDGPTAAAVKVLDEYHKMQVENQIK